MGSDEVSALVLTHGRFVWPVLTHQGIPERQLDDLSQEVFILILRIPMAVVAQSVACTLSTAYSMLHAARKQIRAARLASGLGEADFLRAEVG
jgi:hypothetical protein